MNITKKDTKQILKILLITITFAIALYHVDVVWSVVTKIVGYFRPIIIGFCIAFIINPLVTVLSTKALVGLPHKFPNKGATAARIIAVILTFLIIFGIISLVFLLIIPQVGDAFGVIGQTLPSTIQNIAEEVNGWLYRFNIDFRIPTNASSNWGDLFLQAQNYFTQLANNGVFSDIAATAGAFVSGLVSFFLGIVFSIYFVMNREKVNRFARRFIAAYFNERITKRLYHFVRTCSSSFHRFITGQLTEACILGILCFIGMSIFRFPYALATSALVAVMALIPIFGAWIGAVLGAILCLTRSPITALFFLIFLIVLQQLEGTFIYPRVVGKSVGLPSMLVLAAVTLGASISGLLGLLVAVPICSIFYTLTKETVAYRLEKKQQATLADIGIDEIRENILEDDPPLD